VRGALLVGDFRFCALLFQFDEERLLKIRGRADGVGRLGAGRAPGVCSGGCAIGAGSIFNGGAWNLLSLASLHSSVDLDGLCFGLYGQSIGDPAWLVPSYLGFVDALG
jgi:hypothetical protein